MCVCAMLYLYILLQIFYLSALSTSAVSKVKKCGPLKTRTNVELSCFTIKDSKRFKLPECEGPQLSGTFVAYKCKNFYTALNTIRSSESTSEELFCDESGNWVGQRRYNEFRCKEDCGRVSQNGEPLVINGVETNRTSWPWHATLFEKRGPSWTYICGGTLIRNQVVLTAAHCVVRYVTEEPNPKQFRVILGATSPHYLENALDAETRIHKVVRIYVSEHYDPSKGYQADIAILHLEGNVEYSESIIPICLQNDYNVEANAVKPGISGKVAGFGIQETGKLAKTLHSIELEVRSGIECFSTLQRVLSESQFCAGTTGGELKTLCNGDSGGGISFLSAVHQRYHIHGITSSGDLEKGRCQNYAVFTRIYSFIFWIRDVIEEISGEIARDLHAHVPYPYALTGTENAAVVFRSLPREWENKITSFSLEFVDLDPTVMLEALQFAQTLVSFNLSQVEMKSKNFLAGKRILLPHLKTFQMDLLQDKWELNEERQFPEEITLSYLKNFLFFEKGFGALLGNWKPENLLQLGTDIQFTLGIFKLVHIEKEQGLVALNEVPFAGSILSGLLDSRSEFILQNLAVARCELKNLQIIPAGALTSLTLNNVVLDETDVKQSLKLMTELTKLRITLPSDSDQTLNLNLIDLSENLKILFLSGNISIEAEPGSFKNFPGLRSFICDFCRISQPFLEVINYLFPNLSTIVIRSNQLFTLGSIEIIPSRLYYLVKHDNNWKLRKLSDVQMQKALFAARNGGSFWTSEQEFRAKQRLKTYEKAAMDTGVFKFRGTSHSHSEELTGIPISVQQNLKSIHLSSVRMFPTTLRDSLSHAPLLKEIILENLNFQNKSITVHFKLETISLTNETFSFITEHLDGKLNSIVFPLSNASSSASLFYSVLTEFNAVQVWANTSTIFWLDAVVDDMAEPLRIIRKNANALRFDKRYSNFNWEKFNKLSDYVFFGSEFMPPNFESPGMLLFDDYFVDQLDKYPIILRFLRNRPFLAQHNKWISSRAPFISDVAASKWLHKLNQLPVGSNFALSLLQNQLSTVIY